MRPSEEIARRLRFVEYRLSQLMPVWEIADHLSAGRKEVRVILCLLADGMHREAVAPAGQPKVRSIDSPIRRKDFKWRRAGRFPGMLWARPECRHQVEGGNTSEEPTRGVSASTSTGKLRP